MLFNLLQETFFQRLQQWKFNIKTEDLHYALNLLFHTPQRKIKFCLLKGEAKCEEIELLSLRLESQSCGSCGWEHQREELNPHQSSAQRVGCNTGTQQCSHLSHTDISEMGKSLSTDKCQTRLLCCMGPVLHRRLCPGKTSFM